jgi:hypothetical protein
MRQPSWTGDSPVEGLAILDEHNQLPTDRAAVNTSISLLQFCNATRDGVAENTESGLVLDIGMVDRGKQFYILNTTSPGAAANVVSGEGKKQFGGD